MALFKTVVWALIFLTKLRFLPGVSIAIVLKELQYMLNICCIILFEHTLLRRAFVLWKLMRYFQNISQIITKLRNSLNVQSFIARLLI